MTEKRTTASSARDHRDGMSDLALMHQERIAAPILNKPKTHSERRIPSAVVRELCGSISDMTLWRWLNNPDLLFPQPAYIAGRRYWREADVLAWLDAQAATAA